VVDGAENNAQKELWAKSTADAMEVFKKSGVEIIHPDKSLYMEKVAEMKASIKGTPAYDMLQRINQLTPES